MSLSYNETKLIKILRQLDSDDMHKRIKSINTLAEIGDEICLRELRIRLKSMHDEYQALIIAIGKLKQRLGVK
jgi:HEAT repeat protein